MLVSPTLMDTPFHGLLIVVAVLAQLLFPLRWLILAST
jgi:hypothetical protein